MKYDGERQEPCPCNIQSKAVCAYANWSHICHGRPELVPKTQEEADALREYFQSRSKKKHG